MSLTAIAEQFGEDQCAALPGLHAFTGCDTTSAFSGKGKKAALDLVVAGGMNLKAMQQLEQTPVVSVELMLLCRQFVCALYGRPALSDVNEVRYQIFRTSACQSASLPTTEDALGNHVKRANYQTYVWRHAMTNAPLQSPHGQGWLVSGMQEEEAGTGSVEDTATAHHNIRPLTIV